MAEFRVRSCAVVLAVLFAASLNPAYADTPDPRREHAKSLAASGNQKDALALYDVLTASGSSDTTLYIEAIAIAKASGDMKRVGLYGERQIRIDPGNQQIRALIPVAYQVAGDQADAQRARQEYVAYWKASTDPTVRAKPFFMIDSFRVGLYMVNVLQCSEIAGNFGVEYMFDIIGPSEVPLAPTELLANHRERFVVEHDLIAQKVALELGGDQPKVAATLDLLSAPNQALLRMFAKEPTYPELRELVAQNVASDASLATKPPMNGAWGRVTCQLSGK